MQMKYEPDSRCILRTVESVIMLAPAGLFLIWAIPTFLAMGIVAPEMLGAGEGFINERVINTFIVLGGALSFIELARLNLYSINSRCFSFGVFFWSSGVLGVLALYKVWDWFGFRTVLLLFATIAGSIFRNFQHQKRLRAEGHGE